MGLLNIVGSIVGGTVKLGVMAAGALLEECQKANNVRMNSGHMSDQELINGIRNSRKGYEKAGYAQAFKDRHGK